MSVVVLDMLSQQNQSMTKTSPKSPIAMDKANVNTGGGAVGAGAGSSAGSLGKEKITSAVVTSTNNSSTNACGTATGKNNESGTPNIYQQQQSQSQSVSTPEHLPKHLQSILPVVTLCTYTPCYCEENVWKLCDKVKSDFGSELEYCHVAFISNKKRMVPMWRQKAGKNEEKLALWDYHVILLYNPDDRCVVYDMDSELPFPTHFHRYVSETFRTENILQPEYHRFFRIIPASRFLSMFSSDRNHMLRSDRSWIKPPPNYPPICCIPGVNNLDNFIDMSEVKNEFGEVFTLMELVRKFYKPRQLS